MVRTGICATLDQTEFHGVALDECDLLAWVAKGGYVVMNLETQADLDLVIDLREESADCVLVTISGTSDLATAAVAAGANASLPQEGDAYGVVLALRASRAGLIVLPEALGWDLAAKAGRLGDVQLSTDEQRWLTQLASGATVSDVAHDAGYSSREMFRLLGACYKKLGAEHRTGALLVAAKAGLI